MNEEKQTVYSYMTTQSNDIPLNACVVEETVEVTTKEIVKLLDDPYGEYPFISAHRDKMFVDKEDRCHCLLVKGKNFNDGFLITETESERQVGYLKDAQNWLTMKRYPSLDRWRRKMVAMADLAVKRILEGQSDGSFRFKIEELKPMNHRHFNTELFAQMVQDRPEISRVNQRGDTIEAEVSEEYLPVQNDNDLRMIEREEFEIICAKHTLWLYGEGGERADFSDCLLKNLNFRQKELPHALFHGTKFVDCNFLFAVLSGGEFQNAVLSHVQMGDTDVTGSDFAGTQWKFSNLSCLRISDCSLTGASFYDSDLSGVVMSNSCVKDMVIDNCHTEQLTRYGCYENLVEQASEEFKDELLM